jgi:hypothetical protein
MMPPASDHPLEQYLEMILPRLEAEECQPSREETILEPNVFDHSFSSIDSEDSPKEPQRHIRFSNTLQVREYNVTIGDDRQCAYPMTLTWDAAGETFESLEHWEQRRRRSKPRRLSSEKRKQTLKNFGHSQSELNQTRRKRKTRLTMEYAYGLAESEEAAQCFEDQQFRYIL